jgi:hypothetical protein
MADFEAALDLALAGDIELVDPGYFRDDAARHAFVQDIRSLVALIEHTLPSPPGAAQERAVTQLHLVACALKQAGWVHAETFWNFDALAQDPHSPHALLALPFPAAGRGDGSEALQSWKKFKQHHIDTGRVRISGDESKGPKPP